MPVASATKSKPRPRRQCLRSGHQRFQPERLGEGQALFADVGDRHACHALGPERQRQKQADRPGAEDQRIAGYAPTGLDACGTETVEDTGERLGKGRRIEGEIADPVQMVDGNHAEFGEAAMFGDAVGLEAGAQIGQALPAGGAVAARYVGIDGNPVARLDGGDIVGDRLDRASIFVAGDQGKRTFAVAAMQHLDVGMAKAGGADAHQSVSRLDLWQLQIRHAGDACSGKSDGLHCSLPCLGSAGLDGLSSSSCRHRHYMSVRRCSPHRKRRGRRPCR